MAGLGFKDFAVGEVLTSADVDGYLMQQTVMRFADAGARGSALGTAPGTAIPLAEGMVTYLDDINAAEVYDGSGWTAIGGLAAVKYAEFTGTQTQSLASGSAVAVTSLSVTHSVSNAANRVLLFASIGAAGESGDLAGVGMRFVQDGTAILVGDAGGTRGRVTTGASVATASGNGDVTRYLAGVGAVTPGAGSKTYTVEIVNLRGATQTVYVNRSENDTDDPSHGRAISTLTLMEVRV